MQEEAKNGTGRQGRTQRGQMGEWENAGRFIVYNLWTAKTIEAYDGWVQHWERD